jgi:hypothetical protein
MTKHQAKQIVNAFANAESNTKGPFLNALKALSIMIRDLDYRLNIIELKSTEQ